MTSSAIIHDGRYTEKEIQPEWCQTTGFAGRRPDKLSGRGAATHAHLRQSAAFLTVRQRVQITRPVIVPSNQPFTLHSFYTQHQRTSTVFIHNNFFRCTESVVVLAIYFLNHQNIRPRNHSE